MFELFEIFYLRAMKFFYFFSFWEKLLGVGTSLKYPFSNMLYLYMLLWFENLVFKQETKTNWLRILLRMTQSQFD